MKKVMCICVVLSIMVSVSAGATDKPLLYWHATEDNPDNIIFRMTVRPKIGWNILSAGTFSASNIDAYVQHAVNQWTLYGMPIDKVSFTSANIVVQAGRHSVLKPLTQASFKPGTAGHTERENNGDGYFEKDWVYNSQIKPGYTSNFTRIFILFDTASGTQLYGDETIYKNVILHEVGHALGWHGHSANTTDIMHAQSKSVYTLTSRDVNHVRQIKGY